MHEVHLPAKDLRLLADVIAAEPLAQLFDGAARAAKALQGRSVLNVNTTASGGGVAEMLHSLLPYARGAGVDARWLVIDGDAEFFAITKRIHNHLYGTPGDGGPLGEAEHDHYRAMLSPNVDELAAFAQPGDVVVLHDPQTAGLAPAMRSRGAIVVWRCHVGVDVPNSCTESGWSFLRNYLAEPTIDAYVFTRRAFVPAWVPVDRVVEIPPSIDPFSPKNRELPAGAAVAILSSAGLLAGPDRHAPFTRADGSSGRIEHGCDVIGTGPPPAPDTPLVVQVSRWDRLKDMTGVLDGFAEFGVRDHGAHLVLAGPVVTAVSDDPEGAVVFRECADAWRRLPHAARQRIQLACIPMTDRDENATIVNALQRHATVVVQKSLAEGFGLTAAEAMFKGRAVIASAVGGLAEQVVDGATGILLADPTDLAAFQDALGRLLGDPRLVAAMGERARQRAIEQFLPDRQLRRWIDLLLTKLHVGESTTPPDAPRR